MFKYILNIFFFSFLFSFMQDLTFDGEGLGEYIPMSCLKSDRTFEKYVPLVVHLMCFIFLFVPFGVD